MERPDRQAVSAFAARSVGFAHSDTPFEFIHFDARSDGTGEFIELSTGIDGDVLLDLDGVSGEGRVLASMVAPGLLHLQVAAHLAAVVGCEPQVEITYPEYQTTNVEASLARLPVREDPSAPTGLANAPRPGSWRRSPRTD